MCFMGVIKPSIQRLEFSHAKATTFKFHSRKKLADKRGGGVRGSLVYKFIVQRQLKRKCQFFIDII